MEWRNIIGGVCLVAGVVLLFAVAGTSDVRSLTSTDAGLASGGSVWLMLFAGSFLLGAGAFIINLKGGKKHGKRRAKKIW